MAGSRVQVNKAHKTRFASKASRQVHKTSDKSRISKPERNVSKGARAARIQRNKMLRDQKRAAILKEKRASSGSSSPPRVIVLFGLSASVSLHVLAKDLLALLSPPGSEAISTTVAASDYKLRTTVLEAPYGNLLSCMEMAKVADLIAFVASASSSCEEGTSSSYIDSFGTQCLSVFRALGLPSTAVLIRDLPMDPKKRHDLKKMCSSSLASEFPEDCKFYPADTKDELHKGFFLGAKASSPTSISAVHVAFQGAAPHGATLAKPTTLPYGSEGAGNDLRMWEAEVGVLPRLALLVFLILLATDCGYVDLLDAGSGFVLRDLMDMLLSHAGPLDRWVVSYELESESNCYELLKLHFLFDLVANDCHPGKCTLLLYGYLRAHNLSVNQLIHVAGAGDFQLCKIDVLKDPFPLNARKQDLMDSDELHDLQVVHSLFPDLSKQEPLLVENIPDPLAGEQTWPTEAEMAEADRVQKEKKLKKRTLPRGTSEYQAAWIVEDTDDEDSESGNDADDGMVLDEGENGLPGQEGNAHSDLDDDQASLFDEESEADTAMTVPWDSYEFSDTNGFMLTTEEGENLTREQIEDEIRKIKDAHAEDEEFPDEVDTPLDVPARKRFAKYRGLKSFRTSSWDPKESLPPEYARIFAFDNFTRTQKHVLAKALDMEQGSIDECISAGSYVRLHIKEVPVDVASKLFVLAKTSPVLACGLLQHESKMSVLHFSVKKHDTYSAPIKSKEALTFHVGFRQFVARPIFSSDNFNSDKHKMERFLHAGRFSIASVYAPISFPPLPLIVLKSGEGDAVSPAVAAVGSLRSIDPERIILKKIILTGYPQRVSKLKAIVRYMFHNPEDVRWFKPVEVWTKCGRRGRVKEPVGTHGAMKCIFNGVVQQHDTVCMTLYKRAYPKWPEQRLPILDA
ncbi:hypothetical protein HHK36_002847 [Tetracentron sinense]|uniref:Bms1-type G domain-containing protein n=1 Tax=Tetracentron sinense TaxID=13715 RepID=A0A834ZRN6_TETSI|nr:hypothetical protein HHK36_002847 [Tetracentron sinense]